MTVIRHTETVTRTSDRFACDRCGKPCGHSSELVEVENGMRKTSVQFTLRRREAVRIEVDDSCYATYGGGGDADDTVFDVCADCFREVVVPAMEALGFKPRTVETEW